MPTPIIIQGKGDGRLVQKRGSVPKNSEREPSDPHRRPVPGFTEVLNVLSNPELLSALDLTLLELEKRLLRYARGGPGGFEDG